MALLLRRIGSRMLGVARVQEARSCLASSRLFCSEGAIDVDRPAVGPEDLSTVTWADLVQMSCQPGLSALVEREAAHRLQDEQQRPDLSNIISGLYKMRKHRFNIQDWPGLRKLFVNAVVGLKIHDAKTIKDVLYLWGSLDKNNIPRAALQHMWGQFMHLVSTKSPTLHLFPVSSILHLVLKNRPDVITVEDIRLCSDVCATLLDSSSDDAIMQMLSVLALAPENQVLHAFDTSPLFARLSHDPMRQPPHKLARMLNYLSHLRKDRRSMPSDEVAPTCQHQATLCQTFVRKAHDVPPETALLGLKAFLGLGINLSPETVRMLVTQCAFSSQQHRRHHIIDLCIELQQSSAQQHIVQQVLMGAVAWLHGILPTASAGDICSVLRCMHRLRRSRASTGLDVPAVLARMRELINVQRVSLRSWAVLMLTYGPHLESTLGLGVEDIATALQSSAWGPLDPLELSAVLFGMIRLRMRVDRHEEYLAHACNHYFDFMDDKTFARAALGAAHAKLTDVGLQTTPVFKRMRQIMAAGNATGDMALMFLQTLSLLDARTIDTAVLLPLLDAIFAEVSKYDFTQGTQQSHLNILTVLRACSMLMYQPSPQLTSTLITHGLSSELSYFQLMQVLDAVSRLRLPLSIGDAGKALDLAIAIVESNFSAHKAATAMIVAFAEDSVALKTIMPKILVLMEKCSTDEPLKHAHKVVVMAHRVAANHGMLLPTPTLDKKWGKAKHPCERLHSALQELCQGQGVTVQSDAQLADGLVAVPLLLTMPSGRRIAVYDDKIVRGYLNQPSKIKPMIFLSELLLRDEGVETLRTSWDTLCQQQGKPMEALRDLLYDVGVLEKGHLDNAAVKAGADETVGL